MPAPAPAGPEPQPAAFDMAAALERVDGDAELMKELAGLFLGECPQRMAEIRQAIDQRDASRLHQAAHTLKGSVGNFGARAAFEAAQRLETDGREQDWGQAEQDWAALEEAIGRLEPAFVELGHAAASVVAGGEASSRGVSPGLRDRESSHPPRRGGTDGPGSAGEHEPGGRPASRTRLASRRWRAWPA